jgi:hypothetical protein
MLKFGSIRFRAKCSRHPSYNPALEGEEAIRGACPKCHLLLEIYRAHRQLIDLMQQVKQEELKSPTTKTLLHDRQMDLFEA